ncbi:MAG: flagellar FliJ family protein [Oscillospiraceae bacterium]|jgi:flagellar FliJ protein|nr:flagellar FliJ family protein [Oscillospiraceae bacterium]
MRKFVFTLQTVLNVKRALEKQHMAELSACNARIREFERVRLELIEREMGQHEAFRRQLSEGVSPAELQLWGIANRAARERVEYQDKVLEQAEGERMRIEKKLIGVMQERKILENLRDKQREIYRAEQQRETAMEMTEFLSHEVFEDQTGSTGSRGG